MIIHDTGIIGAATFAPFVLENELIVYILLLKVNENKQRKGSGTSLFNIVKDFVMKCYDSNLFSEVSLLLSASTKLTQHAFFEKQGCQMVTDRNLLKLTQKDATLM